MSITTQQEFQFGIYGDGTSTVANFNLTTPPFSTGASSPFQFGIPFSIGSPSVIQATLTDVDGGANPYGITVQATLLTSILTLTFSSSIPHDGIEWILNLTMIYGG